VVNSIKILVYKIVLFCAVLCFSAFAKAQDCTNLISPTQGETNVSILTDISFELIDEAVNYFVDVGTSPGATDILNNFNAGGNGMFTPPQGLPENTIIYITIRGFFGNGTTMTCDEQSFTTEDNILPPECTFLNSPLDGAIDVSIGTNLSWSYAPRATGYLIVMGTTPGGADILNREDVGNILDYDIPFDLDGETTYYVTIIPFNENGEISICPESEFTTEVITNVVPECTQLIIPFDGQTEVALTPILEWTAVDNADGYLIKVGTSSGGDDVLANTNIGLTTSTTVLDFEEGTMYFVTITPFNAAGEAVGCMETSFTTTLGCGPYFDPLTGETVDLNPVIDLPNLYSRCIDDPPITIDLDGLYDSVTWFEVIDDVEREISSNSTISIENAGDYRVEVTLEVLVEAGFIICDSSHIFTVTVSEPPVISRLRLMNEGITASVFVETETQGDFEYSNVSASGPFQSSPLFTNIDITNINIFVRDRAGCGIVSQSISPDPGFPKYFTPNADGINDYWQVRGAVVQGETITGIEIYDRFGKSIATISPFGLGWDGTYNGKQLLDSGFWYKASTESSAVFIGHFALKR